MAQKSCFAKIINGFQLLTIFAKSSIADVQLGSKYTYVQEAVTYPTKKKTPHPKACSKPVHRIKFARIRVLLARILPYKDRFRFFVDSVLILENIGQ